jgi:hypothetical protein
VSIFSRLFKGQDPKDGEEGDTTESTEAAATTLERAVEAQVAATKAPA